MRRHSKYIDNFDYRERQDALSRLGFRNYGEYLFSDLWRTIRAKVLKRDNYKCRRCGDPASQVHHEAYDIATLSGKELARLKSACHRCHDTSHRRGRVKNLKQLNARQMKHRRKVKERAKQKYKR